LAIPIAFALADVVKRGFGFRHVIEAISPVTLGLLLRRRIRDGWAGWIGFGNVSGPDSNYSDATIFALADDRWRCRDNFILLTRVYTISAASVLG
jgi:hypothetical protein